MKTIIGSLFLILVLMTSCQQTKQEDPSGDSSPNIILMIGDGMGVAQVTAATYWNPNQSNYYKFKTVGLSETSSTSHKVTDSAAGATAFSTGQKTYNRAIGVAPDSTHLKTILETLKEQGYQTGLISLTSITHATPACFYAHVTDRDMHEEIASQLANADVDFFAGGGWNYFLERKDNRNLFEEFRDKGYAIDTTGLPAKLDKDKKHGFLLSKTYLPSKVQGRKDFLQKATALAIDYFKQSDKPYFLMVEGSFIDWGGHARDAQMMIQESVDFDQTIGTVLEKTASDSSTLVVITADHETGGASIGKYYEQKGEDKRVQLSDTLGAYFYTDQHTASLVPVFAKGYREELFAGVYTNDQIYHRLMEACGLSRSNFLSEN